MAGDADFDGPAEADFEGLADALALVLGLADPEAETEAVALPEGPAAPSSVGPQAVRASADTAARAMVALSAVLMMVVPLGRSAERAGLGRAG
ncbi:hypothetical protein ADK75_04655 [Streptomyces virginiae]|uniref:Uncharacterized protein n=1 Tax=Streptomyces virginiae TaxID=1961 RepID=A0A0L8N3W7_STRVG|nr:hypothetical protein ADK75_04655 [Streptomyces virginiae]